MISTVLLKKRVLCVTITTRCESNIYFKVQSSKGFAVKICFEGKHNQNRLSGHTEKTGEKEKMHYDDCTCKGPCMN